MHIKLTVTLIIACLASSLVYSQKKLEVTYKRNDDGTLAKYVVIKRNSMLVKLGEKVYPSTPIATAGTYDKPENS